MNESSQSIESLDTNEDINALISKLRSEILDACDINVPADDPVIVYALFLSSVLNKSVSNLVTVNDAMMNKSVEELKILLSYFQQNVGTIDEFVKATKKHIEAHAKIELAKIDKQALTIIQNNQNATQTASKNTLLLTVTAVLSVINLIAVIFLLAK